MALKPKEAAPQASAADKPAKADKPTEPSETPARTGIAPWLGPIYSISLALVFVGERLLGTIDGARMAFSALGVLGAAASVGLRFSLAASEKEAQRRQIERALALFATLGLVALGIYFAANTETGRGLLGVLDATPDKRARFDGASTVAWIVLRSSRSCRSCSASSRSRRCAARRTSRRAGSARRRSRASRSRSPWPTRRSSRTRRASST